MANRFRQRVFSKQGRKTFWFGGVFTRSTLGSASSKQLTQSLNAGALALRPFTIVRTRGVWQTGTDQQSADELQEIALGMTVVSD